MKDVFKKFNATIVATHSNPKVFSSADDIHKIRKALVEAFGQELAEKITYKNWLRVLRNSL